MVYNMATQLADCGPNPDLRSGKFGPKPTIGLNSDLHSTLGGNWMFAFSTWSAISSPNREIDLFFGLQSLFGQQIAVMTFFSFFFSFWSANCREDLFFLFFNRFLIIKLRSRLFLDQTTFHLPYLNLTKSSWVPLVYNSKSKVSNSNVLLF